MEAATAIDLARSAVLTTAVLVSPVLLVALLVGCLIGLLQSVTQIQDQTISFIPKLLAVVATLLCCLSWMMDYFVSYAGELISRIPATLVGG